MAIDPASIAAAQSEADLLIAASYGKRPTAWDKQRTSEPESLDDRGNFVSDPESLMTSKIL